MNELSRRIGKFESPESLLKAYNALEAEFTRRSQRLKELERSYEELRAEAESPARMAEYAKNALSDEHFINDCILPDENIKQRIIERYLLALKKCGSIGLLGGGTGAAALAPPAMPKSLSEAKRLADIILNS